MSAIKPLCENKSRPLENASNVSKQSETIGSADISCDVTVSQHDRHFKYKIAKQICLLGVWICLVSCSSSSI